MHGALLMITRIQLILCLSRAILLLHFLDFLVQILDIIIRLLLAITMVIVTIIRKAGQLRRKGVLQCLVLH